MFTVIFGIISFFVLPATPATMVFLKTSEKQVYMHALEQDWAGDKEHEPFSWTHVLDAFTTLHVWLLSIPLFFGGRFWYYFLLSSILNLSSTCC